MDKDRQTDAELVRWRQRLQAKIDSKQGQMERDDRQIVTKTADRDTDRWRYRQKADSNRGRQQRQSVARSNRQR